MTLNLNENKETYQEFYGRNIEQIPKLIADGRVSMSASKLMQKRLDVMNASEDVKDYWTNNYFDTGDAVVYHPDGRRSWDRLKIVLDSKNLREMTSQTKRNNGALILGEDVYKALEGEEFTRKQLEHLLKFLYLFACDLSFSPNRLIVLSSIMVSKSVTSRSTLN